MSPQTTFPSRLNLLLLSLFFIVVLVSPPSTSAWSVYPGVTPKRSLSKSDVREPVLDPRQPPSTGQPSPSPSKIPLSSLGREAVSDLEIVLERRTSTIIGSVNWPYNISAWLSTLDTKGRWPDSEVDYTTQCAAQRANWPAYVHWNRTLTLAAAWHGGLPDAKEWIKNEKLRDAIGRAMNWWFANDFVNLNCLDAGGSATCPCTNPPTPANWLFNTNWFSNIILIPRLVGQTCVVLNGSLSTTDFNNCTRITHRAYETFNRNIVGVGLLTGANTLDVAKIGVDEAILTNNVTLITDAYRRVHREVAIAQGVAADGIRPDGSFGQHTGLLYNGNYGKDYANDVLDLEIAAGGTQFAANQTSRNAFETQIDGDRWMIYRNVLTNVLHWDFSALPRFISFAVADGMATASINRNLTQVKELGTLWNSDILIKFEKDLNSNSSNGANAGNTIGNRMYWDNDYMVHRGSNYVSTLKMFSNRTKNTECTNTQNPFGFHLSDGALFTYLKGNEYEDIASAWDWNKIPGITTDYGITPLSCDKASFTGIESMVGGASDGKVGVAAMQYSNPFTKALSWKKAWFFLEDDTQHVIVSDVAAANHSSSMSGNNNSTIHNGTVISVLDQRRHTGSVVAQNDGQISSLWHGDIGYVVSTSNGRFSLQHKEVKLTGNWKSIGTSTQPPNTVDLFSAWIEHKSVNSSLHYTTFFGVDQGEFQRKSSNLKVHSIRDDKEVSAIYDSKHATAMLVTWQANGSSTSVEFDNSVTQMPFTINAKQRLAIIYKQQSGNITVSDPSQSTTSADVTIDFKNSAQSHKTLRFSLANGQSVTKNVYH